MTQTRKKELIAQISAILAEIPDDENAERTAPQSTTMSHSRYIWL